VDKVAYSSFIHNTLKKITLPFVMNFQTVIFDELKPLTYIIHSATKRAQ